MPQPILPLEEQFTDAEFIFRDDEPRRLFPENQDSNWGLLRKIFSDVIDDVHKQLETIYIEMFPQTSVEFLDEWERIAGLPRNPAGKTISERRSAVMARLQQGPFTRSRRYKLVKDFIDPTFGEAIRILPEGVALVPEGVPIYNDTPIGEYFRIIETVELFYYEIQILRPISIDELGLRNALTYIQYSGLHFQIVYVDSFGLVGVETDTALPLSGSNEAAPIVTLDPGAYGYGAYGGGVYQALHNYETDIALPLSGTSSQSADYGRGSYGQGAYGH